MVTLHPYHFDWPKAFETEAHILSRSLAEEFVAVHHIGSTSVPGLEAKPIIDILLIVKDYRWAWEYLEPLGYKGIGEINIPFRWYFKKEGFPWSFHIHMYECDNPEIDIYLKFRDYLRNYPQVVADYITLKRYLASQKDSNTKKEGNDFREYTFNKAPFIQKILQKSNFDAYTVRYCSHQMEWEAYHRLHQFYNLEGNVKQWFLDAEIKYHHIVLYKGVDIVAAGHAQFWDINTSPGVLHSLVVDPLRLKQGHGSQLLGVFEKKARYEGKPLCAYIPDALIPFFIKRGYQVVANDEAPKFKGFLLMGKAVK